MEKKDLIKQLEAQHHNGDVEAQHSIADNLLIEYINDPEIKEAYEKVPKWYA